MFDNRWDNWSGDFAESFAASLLDTSVRGYVPEILAHFGESIRAIDPDFPESVAAGSFAKVMTESMPRLALPHAARAQVPEVIARFFESLQDAGRLGDGDDWAAQIRIIGASYLNRLKPGGGVRGVTIRKAAAASPIGRNDLCPCGSGKKYKKCCLGSAA
ncbi:MAG: motif domain protein [Planctomycetota bacterium]|nr:motif domain protein [Planctomycetota bacterium]